jgi:tetratricopeptide (TPR) repeat protein
MFHWICRIGNITATTAVVVMVLSCVIFHESEGFSSSCPQQNRQQRRRTQPLASSMEEKDSSFESTRQRLESLMTVQQQQQQQQQDEHDELFVKPLTTNTERLKVLELKLLAELEDTDDVVNPLVDLWLGERADAAEALREMETATCSPGLYKEEEQLRDMIRRYGTEWVEPMSRLALLLFTKGRLSEAIETVRTVLEIKPWHFEAGTLLTVMLLRQGDFGGALQAARRYTLPNFNQHTNNKRRKLWVREKVQQAQELFRRAQMATISALQDDVFEECPLEDEYCWQ